MSLKIKLFILSVVPLLAFLIISGFLLMSKLDIAKQAKTTYANAKFFELTSSLVAELQVERGLSTGFLAGGISLEKLNEHRLKVDTKMKDFLNGINKSYLSEGFKKTLADSNDTLSNFRTTVDNRGNTKKTTENYSNLIKLLLEVYLKTAKGNYIPGISNRIKSIKILEIAKENSGKLRANLTPILAKNKPIDEDKLQNIIALKSNMYANLYSDVLTITDETINKRNKFKNKSQWKEVSSTFKSVLKKYQVGGFDKDPDKFFPVISSVVADIGKLINMEIIHLEKDLHNIETKNFQIFSIFLTSIVLFIVGLIIFSVVQIKKIMKPISQTVKAMLEVEKGSLDIQINCNSKDEIGKMAKSINNTILSIQNAFQNKSVDWGKVAEMKKQEEEAKRKVLEESKRAQKAAQEAQEAQKLAKVEQEKAEQLANESKVQAQDLANKVNLILKIVDAVAAGDLTHEITVKGEDPIGRMGKGLSSFFKTLKGNLKQIENYSTNLTRASGNLNSISKNISTNANDTTEKATSVSAATEEISANMNEVSATTRQMEEAISEMNQLAHNSTNLVNEGVKITKVTKHSIEKLLKSAEEIGNFTATINSISQQTNLLALNATIEAARAGDAGKGFAVVANEVKELANQANKASEEISSKVKSIQEDTSKTVEKIEGVSKMMGEIESSTSSIAAAIEEQTAATKSISFSVEEAAKGTKEITDDISSVNNVARETNDSSTEALNTSQGLNDIALDLQKFVSQFKLEDTNRKKAA